MLVKSLAQAVADEWRRLYGSGSIGALGQIRRLKVQLRVPIHAPIRRTDQLDDVDLAASAKCSGRASPEVDLQFRRKLRGSACDQEAYSQAWQA